MRDFTKDSLFRISPTIRQESDRSAAILAAALLDDQLDGLVRAYLLQRKETEPLFRGDGPLASFAIRNRFAFGLGLIPRDIFHDIDKVRQIRNQFAHKIEGLAFDRPPICDIAKQLKGVQWMIDNAHLVQGIKPENVQAVSDSPRR
ncbi:MAG: MltR family transcriptional regulator, partial [Opitutaceae bacterium]